MREILFRGKRVDNGEWVYGNRIQYPKSFKVKGFCWLDGVPVTVKSIGVYIRKDDTDGNKIFTYDIVKINRDTGTDADIGVVEYCKEGAAYIINFGDGTCCAFIDGWVASQKNSDIWIRKIGNIHDNPELLEVAE